MKSKEYFDPGLPPKAKKNYHCLMLFYTHRELGDTYPKQEEYVNTNNIYIDSGIMALNAYAETPCPASQLVSAETKEELEKEIEQMKLNFQNEEWIKENIKPFI